MKQSIRISSAGSRILLTITGDNHAIRTEPGEAVISGIDLTTLAEAVIDAAGPDLRAHLAEYAGSQP